MATVSTSATKGIYDLELITLEDLLSTALQNLNQSKRLDEYLSYLTSEWYTTPEDLRLAYQNDKIWSQITLPGRLKLELIKLIENATDSQFRPPVTTIDQRIMTTTTTTAAADMLKELSPILSEKVPCVATNTTTTTEHVAWTTELDQNRSRAVDHNVELTETDQHIYAIDWSAEVGVEAHDDDVDGGSTVQAADSSSSFSSEWVCCISQEHHCYYYYNISTLESTWEPPEGVYFESVHAYDEHLQQWIALPDDYDVSNHNNYQDNNNNNNDNNDDGTEYYVQHESYDDVNIVKHHDSGNYNNSTNNDDDDSLHHLRASSSPSPVKLSSSAVKKRIIIVDVDDDDSSSDSNGSESPSCNDKMATILQFNDIYGGVEGGDDDKEADLSPKIIGYRSSHFFQSVIDGKEVPVVQIGQHHHHHHQNHHSVSSRSIDAGSSGDDVHDVSYNNNNNNNNNNRPSYDDDNNLPRRPNNPFDYFGEGGWVFSSDQNDYEWVEHMVADPKDDTVVIDDTFAQYQPTEYYVDEDYDRELVASLQAYEFDRDGDDDDFHEYDDAPSAVGQDASLIAATTSTVDAASEEDKAAKLLLIHPSAPIDDDDEVGGCRYGEVDASSPLRINNLFPDEPSMDYRILNGPSPSRLTGQHNDQLFRYDHGLIVCGY